MITARTAPRLDWLCEAIVKQRQASDVLRLLVVDALGRSILELVPEAHLTDGAFNEGRAVLPKPNVWQGEHRLAPRDFFANANARNTALCYCQDDYIAFLDDRVRLGPTWLETVRRGYRERTSMLCGPYDKIEDGPVDTNNVSRAVTPGTRLSIDHRKEIKPGGMRDAPGGWLFGGNFAGPIEWLLDVNGHEEGCDPTGQEDCILGLMLASRGRRIEFSIAMAATQDRTGDVHVPAFPRLDKGPSPRDRSHATIDRFAVRRRTEFTPDLRALRARVLGRELQPFPIPDPLHDHRDWWDNLPIRDTPIPP